MPSASGSRAAEPAIGRDDLFSEVQTLVAEIAAPRSDAEPAEHDVDVGGLVEPRAQRAAWMQRDGHAASVRRLASHCDHAASLSSVNGTAATTP